jgi:hypothetical protein
LKCSKSTDEAYLAYWTLGFLNSLKWYILKVLFICAVIGNAPSVYTR